MRLEVGRESIRFEESLVITPLLSCDEIDLVAVELNYQGVRYVAVLELPPVDSAKTGVKVAVAEQFRAKGEPDSGSCVDSNLATF